MRSLRLVWLLGTVILLIGIVILSMGVVDSAPARARVDIDLSGDAGTGYTTQKTNTYQCGSDATKTYGNSTDTWGVDWESDNFSVANFRARVEFGENLGDTPEMDHISVKVYYTLGTPNVSLVDPTPPNNSIVGSTLRINATTNSAITDCLVQHNATGTIENKSLSIIGGNNCTGNFLVSPSNNSAYTFSVWAFSGTFWGESEVRNVSVVTNPPVLDFIHPLNNTLVNESVLIQYNLSDPDDDLMMADIWISHDLENIYEALYHIDLLEPTAEHFLNFSYSITDYPDGLFAHYHLDGRENTGENETHVRDFVGGGERNGTFSSSGFLDRINNTKFGNGMHDFSSGTSSDRVIIGNDSDWNNVCDNGCSFGSWINVSTLTSREEGVISRYNSTKKLFELTKESSIINYQMWFGIGFGNLVGSTCKAQTTNMNEFEDEWVHVLGTYNITKNQTKIYLNGLLNTTTDCTFDGINETEWREDSETRIGRRNTVSDEAWTNELDEVTVWNRTLTDIEAQRLHEIPNNKHYWTANVTDSTYTRTANGMDSIWNFIRCFYEGFGNWEEFGFHNCVINEDTDLLGNDLVLSDLGTFTVGNAQIYNYDKIVIRNTTLIVNPGGKLF